MLTSMPQVITQSENAAEYEAEKIVSVDSSDGSPQTMSGEEQDAPDEDRVVSYYDHLSLAWFYFAVKSGRCENDSTITLFIHDHSKVSAPSPVFLIYTDELRSRLLTCLTKQAQLSAGLRLRPRVAGKRNDSAQHQYTTRPSCPPYRQYLTYSTTPKARKQMNSPRG